jgi:hypothetical protein
MCGVLGWRKLRTVNAATTQITLELELDGDTISGYAVDAEGVRHPFSGWIGLMGVLDTMLAPQHSRNGDQPC